MSFVRNGYLTRRAAVGSAILAVATLGSTGCGGKGERQKAATTVTTDAGPAIDPCNLSATLETQLIGCPGDPDVAASVSRIYCPDWEHGTPSNAHTDNDPVPVTLTNETASDCKNSPPGTVCIYPSSGSMDPSPIPTGEGHCGTGSHAYHLVAKGQLRWGPSAYIQYEYSPYPTDGIDVSDWEGLAFWVKKGPEPTGESMFVSIMDKPTNGEAVDANGVTCLTAPLAPDPVKCDSFGFSISIESTWKYVVLPFSDLRQRGFGVHADSVDLAHVVQLKFGLDIGDWDVWIDDVALYRHR